MARSVSNVRIATAFVADQISIFAARCGFASTAGASSQTAAASGGARPNMNWMKKGEEATKGSKPATSWVPDPVTGYYKPEGQAAEIDAVELRNLLLKHKN